MTILCYLCTSLYLCVFDGIQRVLVKTALNHDGLPRRHHHDGPSLPWRPILHWSPRPLLLSHHGPCSLVTMAPVFGHHSPCIWSSRPLYLVTMAPVSAGCCQLHVNNMNLCAFSKFYVPDSYQIFTLVSQYLFHSHTIWYTTSTLITVDETIFFTVHSHFMWGCYSLSNWSEKRASSKIIQY